jgi:orotate phosphoribosyltransferase
VDSALVTVDREEGGPEAMAELGVTVYALLTQTDLRAAL